MLDLSEATRDNIEKDLDELFSSTKIPSNKLIIMAHSPPHNTCLDVTKNGRHVGSHSLLSAIQKHKPLLTFHGTFMKL